MGTPMMWLGLAVTALSATPAALLWLRDRHERVRVLVAAMALEYAVGGAWAAALQGAGMWGSMTAGLAVAVLLAPALWWLARRALDARAERRRAAGLLESARGEAAMAFPFRGRTSA